MTKYSLIIKEATRDALLKARSIIQGNYKKKIITNEVVAYIALTEYIKKHNRGVKNARK
jgi:hypothetical protein